MIQIYSPSNTDFEKNGDMVLMPTACAINAELNGAWTIELEHPIDKEGRWKWIEETAVIKVPSFLAEDQLFRLKSVEKSDAGISASGEPVFMDAMDDCFLTDIRPTNKTGQEALDLMTAPNSKYTGISNISRAATAYYEYKNLIEAINSDDENSFINRWGGEILFDNYTVKINDRVGGDYGVELRYGKNIPQDGLRETIDTNEVVTRIYPQAYNGYKLSGDGYVDSELIEDYPIVKIATMTFDDVKMIADASEDDEENGIIVCENQTELDAALTQKCEEEFENGLDKPNVNIEAEIAILKNTEQYKDYAVLEDVGLGDTIHCKHNRLGIVTDARVISLEYDCVLKKANSVELGDFTYNYFNNVSSTVNRVDSAIRADGTVIAQQIQGIVDGMKASLRVQKSIAEKQDVRAILFEDLDTNSTTYGAMCLGTQGFQIANSRTSDGRDWDWRTFGTSTGFSADLITAGTLAAINILGSVITGGTISGTTITGSTIRGNTISGGTISGTTINGGTLTSESANRKLKITISNGKILIDNNGDANTLNEIQLTYEGGNTVRLSSTGLRMQDNSGNQTTVIYPGRIYLNGKSIT
jgi:phage minor structural protein, N-terminal domain protein